MMMTVMTMMTMTTTMPPGGVTAGRTVPTPGTRPTVGLAGTVLCPRHWAYGHLCPWGRAYGHLCPS